MWCLRATSCETGWASGAVERKLGDHARVGRILIAAVIAGAAAATGGCNDDDRRLDPSSQAVADAILAFTNAVADGDGANACEKLTERGQERLKRVAKAQLGTTGESCAEAVEAAAAKLPGPALDALRAPAITEIRAGGANARATIEPPGDLKELALAAGMADVSAEVRLAKRAGAWKLDDFRR
jgi:hypothetical protein